MIRVVLGLIFDWHTYAGVAIGAGIGAATLKLWLSRAVADVKSAV